VVFVFVVDVVLDAPFFFFFIYKVLHYLSWEGPETGLDEISFLTKFPLPRSGRRMAGDKAKNQTKRKKPE
jgi:hypothetical protein